MSLEKSHRNCRRGCASQKSAGVLLDRTGCLMANFSTALASGFCFSDQTFVRLVRHPAEENGQREAFAARQSVAGRSPVSEIFCVVSDVHFTDPVSFGSKTCRDRHRQEPPTLLRAFRLSNSANRAFQDSARQEFFRSAQTSPDLS